MAESTNVTHWIRAEVIFGIDLREHAADYGMTDAESEHAIVIDMREHLRGVLVGTAVADYTTVDRVTVQMGPVPMPRELRQALAPIIPE